jgi:hypothetical protein
MRAVVEEPSLPFPGIFVLLCVIPGGQGSTSEECPKLGVSDAYMKLLPSVIQYLPSINEAWSLGVVEGPSMTPGDTPQCGLVQQLAQANVFAHVTSRKCSSAQLTFPCFAPCPIPYLASLI